MNKNNAKYYPCGCGVHLMRVEFNREMNLVFIGNQPIGKIKFWFRIKTAFRYLFGLKFDDEFVLEAKQAFRIGMYLTWCAQKMQRKIEGIEDDE